MRRPRTFPLHHAGGDGSATVARRRGEARVQDPRKRRYHGREFEPQAGRHALRALGLPLRGRLRALLQLA